MLIIYSCPIKKIKTILFSLDVEKEFQRENKGRDKEYGMLLEGCSGREDIALEERVLLLWLGGSESCGDTYFY